MSAHAYTILREQAQEDALHAQRLLQVEERPFERVKKKLLEPNSLLRWNPPRQLPSPPPDGQDPETAGVDSAADSARRERFREDILLDFAAVESSILRIQLIQASNAQERERYAAEKAKILETAQAIKNNTVELRAQLVEAQRLLTLRKGYDELAAKLIDPKKLKPRAETLEDIEKLEKEIEDLQQESAEYEVVWIGRREAFDRVVGEGESMIKVIKGIKDEPEPEADKDERMEDGEEGESGNKRERSRIGTPAPEAGTPMIEGETPLPDTAAHTPRPNDAVDEEGETRFSSVAATPLLQAQEDVDMDEEHQTPVQFVETEGSLEPLESQSKITEGMEGTTDQVLTPAEGAEEEEYRDEMPEDFGLSEEHLIAAKEMDET